MDFDLNIQFSDTVSYLKFKNATTDALTIAFTDTALIGATQYPSLTVKLGTISHESAKVATDSDTPELVLKGKATYNTGDASLAVVTVVSSRQYQTA